jgi:hypothetical protein
MLTKYQIVTTLDAAIMSRKRVLTLLVLTLLAHDIGPGGTIGAIRTVGITWITQPFVERFQAHLGVHRFNAMWTFWLEPVSRRMCIRQRIEWDGLLLGSDHETLLAMTVADL